MQSPLAHPPVAHTFPHAPQLFGSVSRSVHWELHVVLGDSQGQYVEVVTSIVVVVEIGVVVVVAMVLSVEVTVVMVIASVTMVEVDVEVVVTVSVVQVVLTGFARDKQLHAEEISSQGKYFKSCGADSHRIGVGVGEGVDEVSEMLDDELKSLDGVEEVSEVELGALVLVL